MDRQGLIERWRGQEVKETAALVVEDKTLQRVLAAWPMVGTVDSGIPCFAPGEDESWDGVWSGTWTDLERLAGFAGLQLGQAVRAFSRAKGLRLIYPDGTIHGVAKVVLQKRIKDAVQG